MSRAMPGRGAGPRATSGKPFITRGSGSGSAAGALLVANNLSDVASASTSRTNLGLGTAALLAQGAVLLGANNLSDVASPTTARSNLGIAGGGSIAAGAQAGDSLVWDGTNWVQSESEMTIRGFKAWSGPPVGSNTGTPASQTEIVTKILLPYNISATNICIVVSTAGATLTSGQNVCTLYNQAGTKIGATADQSAVWTTSGYYVMPITGGPFALTGGNGAYCWVSILSNGTTPGTFRAVTTNGPFENVGGSAALTGAALFAGRVGTTVTAPATFTPSTLVQTNALQYWIGLS